MAQSPPREKADPLVGQGSVEQQSKPDQMTDAQQRPGELLTAGSIIFVLCFDDSQ